MEDFSVAIIAKNEAAVLPRLLKSLKGIKDIFVCDTGSTDSTVEVAKSFGCNVVSVGDKFRVEATEEQIKQWKEKFGYEPSFKAGKKYFHFANARNFAASHTKNDWVFQPDCLPGGEYIFIRDKNGIKLETLEGLFEQYSSGIQVGSNGKEFISLIGKGIEILSPKRVFYIQYGTKAQCQKLRVQGLNVAEIATELKVKRSTVFSYLTPSTKKSSIPNLEMEWTPLRYVSRRFCNKDIIEFISSQGEISLSREHKIASIKSELKNLVPAEKVSALETSAYKLPKIISKDFVDLREFVDSNYQLDGKYIKKKFIDPRARGTDDRRIRYLLKGDDLKSFCRILGAYVSEGSLSDWEITFVCGYEKDFIDQVKNDVEKITAGFNLRISISTALRYKKNQMLHLRVGHKLLWEIINNMAGRGSSYKKVPNFLFGLKEEYIKEFLKTYVRGDGNIRRRLSGEQVRCFTNSKKLASGLTFLYTRLGKQCSFGRKKLFNGGINYTVRACDYLRNRNYSSRKNISNATDYFYDVTTGNGKFIAGLGFTPIKNCDEEMTWDLEKVREAIQNEDHLVYKFCYFHEPDGSCGLQISQSKFYRKSKMRWTGFIHEVLQAIPGQNPKPPIWCEEIDHHHWQQGKGERGGQYLAGLELSVLENPEHGRNIYYYSRELMYAGEHKKAIKFFDKAISLGKWIPELNQAYTYRGLCYRYLGKVDEAVESFHKAMMLADNRREPFWELGSLYEEKKELDRALVYYRAALAIPFRPQGYLANKLLYGWKILDKIVYLYDKMGQKEEAKKYWIEMLKNNPPLGIVKSGVEQFYDKLPLVSIVIPTVRSEGYERLIKSINARTAYPNYEVVKMRGSGTAIEKFNKGVKESSGQFIVYLADDCEVKGGWLVKAFVCFKENFRDRGLASLNDGYWGERGCTHFLCSRNIQEELGGEIFHSGYKHVCCDTELRQRLKKKNLFEFCQEAKIIHHHYCTQTRGTKAAPIDEFYEKIEEHQEEDRKLLYKRQKELSFGPKIAAFCTTYNEEARIKEFVEENLKYVDEVYISDNGSTDKTVEIAEEAGAKVKQSGLVCTPENYVEGKIKQKALEFAREGDCNWFLYLDADEILEERARDILPILINDQRYDSYGMQKPTFWMGRTHFRTDSDFGQYYLQSPYPLKLWNREVPIEMTIAPRGAHSYPALHGDPNTAYPLIRHIDSELRVKHYSFDTREEVMKKYNMYRKVDPIHGMSRTAKKYEHLHPDFSGIKLEKWEDNPKK